MFDLLFKTFKFKSEMDKAIIKTLFDTYMSNIPDNFYKNQFDLAKEYGGSYEDWVRILSHNAFDSWKGEQIAIIAKTRTDKALAGGEDISDKNALPLIKVRQEVLNAEKKSKKPTIIVLPDTLYFKDENGK